MTQYESWEKDNKRMNRRRAIIVWVLCIAGSWLLVWLAWKLLMSLAYLLSHAND